MVQLHRLRQRLVGHGDRRRRSTWSSGYDGLYVGDSAAAILSITNGGTVTGNSYYGDYIGYYIGSAGTATVNGAGSTWTTAATSTSATPAPEP